MLVLYGALFADPGAATNWVSLSFYCDPDCTVGWLSTVAIDHQSFPNWALRCSADVITPAEALSARIELAADAVGWVMNISWDEVAEPSRGIADTFPHAKTSRPGGRLVETRTVIDAIRY